MYINPKFKIVEINNVASLRNGHIVAQTPAYTGSKDSKTQFVAKKVVNGEEFVENGIIVGYDQEGVLANYDPARHAQPMLVYTEELETSGLLAGLDQYANKVEDKVVYLRALPLNIGDSFTTDNVDAEATGGFAKVVNGVLTLQIAATGADFIAVKSNLPAGQEAYEFTYIGTPVSGARA